MEHDTIVQAYLDSQPTRRNSRQLVKQLSQRFDISENKLRSILICQSVYISQPANKAVVDKGDKKAILSRFDNLPGGHEENVNLFREVVKDFGYSEAAIWNLRQQHRYSLLPLTSGEESAWRNANSQEQSSLELQERLQAESEVASARFRKEIEQINRESRREMRRFNSENSFFSDPTWPMQAIFLMFLVGLVITGMKLVLGI